MKNKSDEKMDSLKELVSDSRANGEIIFIGLLTVSVAAIGMGGMAVALDITEQTQDVSDDLGFELISAANIQIEYDDGPIIDHRNTDRLYITGGEEDHVIYDRDEDEGDIIQEGDVVLDPSSAEDAGIENGMSVSIIWEERDGGSQIVEEVYIADEEVVGTSILTDGSSNTTIDESNVTIG